MKVRETINNGTILEVKNKKISLNLFELNKYFIPTLEEILSLQLGDLILNIELKGKGTAIPTMEILMNYFNKHLIKKFRNEIQVNYSNHPLAILICANKDLLTSIFNLQNWTFASLRINYYPIPKLPFLLKYKYNLD